MPEQDAVEALAGVAPVGADRAPGPERVGHAAAGRGRRLAAQGPEDRRHGDAAQGDELRRRHHAENRPARVAAEELDHEAQERVAEEVAHERLARVPAALEDEEKDAQDERAQSFVDLGRVKGNVERHAHVLVRLRVGERDRPGERALAAPAAAREEAADAAQGLPERDGRRRDVGEREERDLALAKEHDRGHERADQAAVEHAAGPREVLQAAPGRDVLRPFDDHEEELRSHESRQEKPDADVRRGIGRDAEGARAPPHEPQARDEAEGHHHPVARKGEAADVDQLWVHVSGSFCGCRQMSHARRATPTLIALSATLKDGHSQRST